MAKTVHMSRKHSRTWDENDLIRRLCHALEIASLAVKHLAPAGYCDGGESSSNIRPEKPIAETAVLLHAAARVMHHPEVSACIHRVAGELAPHARSLRIRLGLALNPALAFDYSIGHILLTRLGYPDSGFDALLQQSRFAQARGARERTPHRTLEQEWLAGLWRDPSVKRAESIGTIARHSILNQPMDLFGACEEDLYAFTHCVMYLTAFGLDSTNLPRKRAIILAEAEAALARCIDAQDYDLAAEILLAWPLTGKSWSPTAIFAFRVLADVEDEAGFLPTPATRISELKRREGVNRTNYLLATSYHTAYVMGLLCSAALQPGHAPPNRIPVRGKKSDRTAQMLPYLSDQGIRPHWRDTFDRLDQTQAETLAGLLFTIALQRRVARRDFGGLTHVLRHGYHLGLADTPAASQAAELLERISTHAHTMPAATPASEESEHIGLIPNCIESRNAASIPVVPPRPPI